MKNTFEKIKLYISVIFSAILVIGLYFWLKGDILGEEKIKPGKVDYEGETSSGEIQTLEVSEKEVKITSESIGSLHARYSTEISPKIMATILKIAVNSGEEVKQGDLLAELDDKDGLTRVNQVKKNLEAAEADLLQAKSDMERHKSLYEQGVESKQALEKYETALKVASARVEQTKEMLKEVEVFLSYTKIYAPYEGRITDKMMDKGETAMPGRAILKMYNPQRLRLEAAVSESLNRYIKMGDKLTVKIDAYGCQTEGVVEEIVPSADIASRTFIAKVSVPCQVGLYEGMFGRIVIPIGTRKTILVPKNSVYNVGQLEMIKILDKNNKIEKRAIKTGKIYDKDIEILSGIKTQEKIILNP